MRVLYFIIPVIGVLLFSCTGRQSGDAIIINGQFENAAGVKVLFSELGVRESRNLDSAFTDPEGKFSFTCRPEETGFYLVTFQGKKSIVLVIGKGEKIDLSGNLDKTPFEYMVTGSKECEMLREFFLRTERNEKRADSLKDILRQSQDNPDFYRTSFAIDSLFQMILENQQGLEIDFIDKNLQSLSSLLVLNYAFGPTPVLQEKDHFDLYLKLDSSLMKVYPSNKHSLYHHQRVMDHLRQETVRKIREGESGRK